MNERDHSAIQKIGNLILFIRGHRVIIDADLAILYGVKTKAFNQAIKRNQDRFPKDFMFRLTEEEKSQLVTNCDRFQRLKHSSSCPLAFTEYGAIMAASVLNSSKAIQVSVYVVRTFTKLRQLLSTNRQFSEKLALLERKVEGHDSAIRSLVAAIRDLTEPILPVKRRRIGI